MTLVLSQLTQLTQLTRGIISPKTYNLFFILFVKYTCVKRNIQKCSPISFTPTPTLLTEIGTKMIVKLKPRELS